MGVYIFINDQDRISKRTVADEYVNQEFQEALKYDPSLIIEQYPHLKRIRKGWFKTKLVTEPYFNIYHEIPAHDGSAYQARYQASASGDRRTVIAYLHGIINGSLRRVLNRVRQLND